MKIGIKTLLQYLLFVGLPLLGVLVALALGRNLGAPAAVHGTWALAIPQQPALQCQAFAGWNGETQMAISQSGPDLIIVFSDKALTSVDRQSDGSEHLGRDRQRRSLSDPAHSGGRPAERP